jgi:hypothetical protein
MKRGEIQVVGQCLQCTVGGMEREWNTKALLSHLQDSVISTLNSAENGQSRNLDSTKDAVF